jgi:hypothetical protein
LDANLCRCKLQGSQWFTLAFMNFWYVFLRPTPFTLLAYEDCFLNAYAWLLLGVLFRLPKRTLSVEFAAGVVQESPARRWIV